MENPSWRVKLYQLEIGGVWNDQGTGFVSCDQIACDDTVTMDTPSPSYAGCYLMVRKEENDDVLLQSAIQYDDAYERQGESIIMWREHCASSGHEIDYALSFENTAGCYAIWDAINDVQAFPYKISAVDAVASSFRGGGDRGETGAGAAGAAGASYQHYHDQDIGGEWLPASGSTGGWAMRAGGGRRRRCI
jgi:hypothetical protein